MCTFYNSASALINAAEFAFPLIIPLLPTVIPVVVNSALTISLLD